MTRIQVVAAVIHGEHEGSPDHILISQRPNHLHQGGLWEFPGGKIEGHETPYQCLLRELKEELDIVVTKATPLMQITHDYADKKVSLDIWTVTEFNGLPLGVEGQEVRWVSLQDLPNFKFPAANQLILARLCDQG
jgi:8-oxo-dGTP diphosphatase